jgi:hypothetical protein
MEKNFFENFHIIPWDNVVSPKDPFSFTKLDKKVSFKLSKVKKFNFFLKNKIYHRQH